LIENDFFCNLNRDCRNESIYPYYRKNRGIGNEKRLEKGVFFPSIYPFRTGLIKEDMDFYIMIRKKKMMCEEWGIHIETQFPSMKAFYNYETLEHDFNQFLEERKSKESPKEIEYNGCNQDKKDEKQAFYDEEAETEDAYLDSLLIGYEEFYISQKSQKNNSDFVPNAAQSHLLQPDMMQDFLDEDEVEVPDTLEKYSGKKIKLKNKSKTTIQEPNSDFVLNELEVTKVTKVRIISYDEFLKRLENKKIASQKVLPSPDMPQDVPKE
jgi:hypothetical protein